MAAFCRKPLRRAKLFRLFDDEHFDWRAVQPPKPEPAKYFGIIFGLGNTADG
jgi:hypothetical protein